MKQISERKAVFDAIMLCIIGVFFFDALGFEGRAKTLPLIIATPAFVLCIAAVLRDLIALIQERKKAGDEESASRAARGQAYTELKEILWVVGFIGMILLTGFLVAVPVYIFVYLRFRARLFWAYSIAYPVGYLAVMYLLFIKILHVQLYEGYLFSLFG